MAQLGDRCESWVREAGVGDHGGTQGTDRKATVQRESIGLDLVQASETRRMAVP